MLRPYTRELIDAAAAISRARWRRAEREDAPRSLVELDLATPSCVQQSSPTTTGASARVTNARARLSSGLTLEATEDGAARAIQSFARLLAAVAECDYALLGLPTGPLRAAVTVLIGEPDRPHVTLQGDEEGVWRLYGHSSSDRQRLGCGMSPAMAFPFSCRELATWSAGRSMSTVDLALQRIARRSHAGLRAPPLGSPVHYSLWQDLLLADGSGERLERVGIVGKPGSDGAGFQVTARLGSLAEMVVRSDIELDALRGALWWLAVYLSGFAERDAVPGTARSFADCPRPLLTATAVGGAIGPLREVGAGNRRWEVDFQKPAGDGGTVFGPGPLDPLLCLLPELNRW